MRSRSREPGERREGGPTTQRRDHYPSLGRSSLLVVDYLLIATPPPHAAIPPYQLNPGHLPASFPSPLAPSGSSGARDATTHLEEGLLLPGNALVDVGGGVREALGLARLAAEETVEVGADLVGAAGLNGVALRATSLEEVGALGDVTWESARLLEDLLGGAGRVTLALSRCRSASLPVACLRMLHSAWRHLSSPRQCSTHRERTSPCPF